METEQPASGHEVMRNLLLLLAGTAATSAFGQPPPGYYDPAMGLSGAALKAALHDIISPHTVHSYGQLWNDFESTDDRDDNGKVWDIYSDIPGGSPPYLFTFGSDQCGSYDSEDDCYNREHTVPQSWFNSEAPMVSDLFHVYPTDGWVNNKRGDLPYGEVGSPDWTSLNGSTVGYCTAEGYPYTVFEPIDAFKGDLARTYFYMMTRYMDVAGNWSSDMFSNGDLAPWVQNMLLQWNVDDPVSQKEIDRNNAVYAIQDNRNPYIDHPEWPHAIWATFVGVAEQEGALALWYADGALHRTPSAERNTATIVDAAGRPVFSAPFNASRLDLPEMPHGMFVARVGDKILRFAR